MTDKYLLANTKICNVRKTHLILSKDVLPITHANLIKIVFKVNCDSVCKSEELSHLKGLQSQFRGNGFVLSIKNRLYKD